MPALVTVDQLRSFAPYALNPEAAAQAFDQNMARCEINTPRRIRHFMAHVYVESEGLSLLEENLNYSIAGLTTMWPSHFPTPASAIPYARNPRALATKVYNGRMGNVGPLDGWLYRGSGYLMLTGKDNYKQAAVWVYKDIVSFPDMARTIPIAAQIACDFWLLKGLNKVVDQDADEAILSTLSQSIKINEEDDLERSTRIITGAQTGLDARRAALLKAASTWK